MIFPLIEYSLAVIFVIFIVFVAWQLICIFTLKIINPVLTGLDGKAISLRSCENSLSLLDSFSDWVNNIDIRIRPLPEIDINFSPNTNLILMLILMVATLALTLNLLSEVLKKIDFTKIWDTIIKMLAGIGVSRAFGTKRTKPGYKPVRQTKLKRLQPNSIFISYRRKDSADVVGRIYEKLADYFGKATVFKDVDSIQLGTNFPKELKKAIFNCKVLLAVIGDRWLERDQSTGKSCLEDKGDYVRFEIESALNNNIPVIQLLVQDAKFPSVDELPASLKKLPIQNGLRIRPDPDFRIDMDRLIKALEMILKKET